MAVGSMDEIGIWMLAQHMTCNFCAGVCATTHKWKIIQLENGEYPKWMTRKNNGDMGEPIGVVLSATKTIRLPMKQQYLFEFFINNKTRSQWDVLSNNGPMQQLVHISTDQNFNSGISLLCPNGDNNNAKQINMLIFQDACMDAAGYLLVYGIVNSQEINMMIKGGDSSFVHLLSNVISIVQDCSATYNGSGIFGKNDNGVYSGSLVTIGFQMMANNLSATSLHMESIKNANDIISYTIHKIKTTLKCK
uniref:Homeobox protein n=1 Tax=Solanum tuberosum TaxID=4113 RepID=M1DCX5_SOLTU